MKNKLWYWKESIENLRGGTEPELIKALAFARRRAKEIERTLFRGNDIDTAIERLLE